MLEYILRLLILLPLVGGMAWGSLWLWKRVQMGVPLTGGAGKQARPVEMIGVLPLGPGTKLAVVEFAGQQILLSVSRGNVTRLADNSQGDFHVG
ncbi:flagellar biosynthetic protein FliO [Sphingopyxis sp. BSN-002]|uniref:flagellar biosynthetic protein FliO n=1 Tax=Sphingopyxis sp. BSN-002 TaxID=2911495 RepID=UPI001EDA2122|nr:flagellar biosynthetic protein FliO [Sphingopyxis sp. BSN-002]UKK83187.1 flagellar biosynthetic protein FliO [Sphingopyxis sp. BSN-002]